MITSTITAQKEEREQTLLTKLIGNDIDSNDIMFANQIFIEHKSFLKQNKDLNEVIRVIRMELDVEKADGIRLRKELEIHKELKVDQGILNQTNEIKYENTISELQSNNFWYRVTAIVATLTTIFVVVTK